jgi:hypothetical protein
MPQQFLHSVAQIDVVVDEQDGGVDMDHVETYLTDLGARNAPTERWLVDRRGHLCAGAVQLNWW